MRDEVFGRASRCAAGAVLLAGLAAGGSARADVSTYLVQLQYNYEQAGPASVAPDSYAFFAAVNATSGDIGTARVASPGTAGEETMFDVGDGAFQYGEVFDNEPALLDAYGPGFYTFTIFGGAAGFDFGDVAINFPIRYPSEVPQFDAATWTAMQALDPSADFTLNFNTFTTIAPNSRTAIQIAVEATSLGVVYDEIPASQGSYTIPAGTLSPDERYTALIYFIAEEVTPDAGLSGADAYSQVVAITFAPLTTFVACRADLNGDGLVDFSDYLEFLNLYDAGDLRVDFNGDGLVDFSDYLEFLNLYDAGC
ncbi:MAG: hypothetical protein IT436_07040 [Phycisphaerales bacterium]|nr:hypothetical protein [Phycisphaerales bacterium]